MWCLVLTCLVCWMSPKQVWSWCLSLAGALLFSLYNMVWRSFLWAKSSGCWSFGSPSCFISAKCGFSISARFLIHGAHVVWFCAVVPSWILSLFLWFICIDLYCFEYYLIHFTTDLIVKNTCKTYQFIYYT
jgi:hypothetical protein